jgi:hypothetical protein
MNIITFIDPIGRNILGEQVEKTDSLLTIKNPAMINVAQTQNGQLQVQLIPLFFAEFVDESVRAEGTTWDFNVNQIVVGNVSIDGRLVEQYVKVFNAFSGSSQSDEVGESVVKLFDE